LKVLELEVLRELGLSEIWDILKKQKGLKRELGQAHAFSRASNPSGSISGVLN